MEQFALIMATLRSRCGHYIFVLFLSATYLLSPKSTSEHHRTTLLGYIFATKARIDNQKKTC